MKTIIAQIVGGVAMVFVVAAFQSNSKRRILILQGVSAGIFTTHFILLGAYTGAGMNAVEVVRNLVFWKCENTKRKMLLVAVFSAVFITVGVFTWQNTWSILPILAQSLATIAVSLKKPKYIRLCFAPVFTLWLVYNIVSMSIAGILTEIFDLSSLAIAVWRFDRKEGKNNEQSEDS